MLKRQNQKSNKAKSIKKNSEIKKQQNSRSDDYDDYLDNYTSPSYVDYPSSDFGGGDSGGGGCSSDW